MSEYHITRGGTRIALCDMSESHLENTIRLIERRAKEGILIEDGGGDDPESYWYDRYMVYGKEALDAQQYDNYIVERKRREQDRKK